MNINQEISYIDKIYIISFNRPSCIQQNFLNNEHRVDRYDCIHFDPIDISIAL